MMAILLFIKNLVLKLAGKSENDKIGKWVEKIVDNVKKKRYIDKPEKKNLFDLKSVDFDAQRDNLIDPHKTCYPTSVKMTVHTLETELYGGQARPRVLRDDWEDWLIKHIRDNRSKYQKITFSIVRQKWAAKMFPRYIGAFWVWYINNEVSGMRAKYKYFTRQGLKDFIRKYKIPVVISTKLTASGHITVAKGHDDDGFICNDPYGDAKDYSKYPSPKYGKNVYYENKRMKKSIGCLVITNDATQ